MNSHWRSAGVVLALGLAAVGCTSDAKVYPAPEIVGIDQDGVEFKLSDHRGKVVLLDFWGNW